MGMIGRGSRIITNIAEKLKVPDGRLHYHMVMMEEEVSLPNERSGKALRPPTLPSQAASPPMRLAPPPALVRFSHFSPSDHLIPLRFLSANNRQWWETIHPLIGVAAGIKAF
jgi:hypothetical protein